MLKHALGLMTVLFVLLTGAVAYAADSSRLLGNFGSWEAWELENADGKVCYMMSKAGKHSGAYKTRGSIYALVTHRPAEGSKNVFSYMAGYEYQAKSEATLKIGDNKFPLFTQGETAWAPDADTDNAIAVALRKGSSMVVTGTSSRGTVTTDTFSLKGSGDAHEAINKACGL